MTDPSPLSVSTVMTDRHALVTINGEIDLATAPEVEAAIRASIDDGAGSVAIDMSGTTFMTCAGIGALVAARHHGQHTHVSVGVTRPSTPVSRMLRLGGVAALLLSATSADDLTPA